MKIFKYKFSKLIRWLSILGLALCVAGFTLNLYFAISQGTNGAVNPAYPIIQYTVMFAVTVILFAVLLSILISSNYSVDGKYFKTKFGFIVSKYEIERVTEITLDRNTNKLSVTFEDGNFIVVVVNEEWYSDFVQALLDVKPTISYRIISKKSDSAL